jgi:hypothetical protein
MLRKVIRLLRILFAFFLCLCHRLDGGEPVLSLFSCDGFIPEQCLNHPMSSCASLLSTTLSMLMVSAVPR